MSLPGDSRSQYGPQCSDLISQSCQSSGVVQHHICGSPAILPRGLSCDPGLGLGPAEPVARHQPLNLSFLINIDGDHKVEILLLTGLDQ